MFIEKDVHVSTLSPRIRATSPLLKDDMFIGVSANRHLLSNSRYELDIIRHLTEKASAEAHQKGLQQGEKERSLKNIFDVLTLRLQPEAVLRFKPTSEQIDDPQQLQALLRAATLANTPEDFQQVLEENGN